MGCTCSTESRTPKKITPLPKLNSRIVIDIKELDEPCLEILHKGDKILKL